MGNEQSRDGATTLGGTETLECLEAEEPHGAEGSGDDVLGRDSPRPSICSDADLPYISYTVNRPIGDSPKHTSKGVRALRVRASTSSSSRILRKRPLRPQEVVVVREGNSNKMVADPELVRLQSIPTFLPIMRGALTAPSARDPEVLERLDTVAFYGLCHRYQIHLHAAASLTAGHQDKLTAKIREVDGQVNGLVTMVTERQRNYARHAERLSQVTEVGHLLSRCHMSLNLILESLETLNNFLPLEDRLEPFVWTTG